MVYKPEGGGREKGWGGTMFLPHCIYPHGGGSRPFSRKGPAIRQLFKRKEGIRQKIPTKSGCADFRKKEGNEGGIRPHDVEQ